MKVLNTTPIFSGQKIPPGLHVRVNFQTGITEAKILDDTEKDEPSHAVAITESDKNESEDDLINDFQSQQQTKEAHRKHLESVLKNIRDDGPVQGVDVEEIRKQYKSYEELKRDLEEIDMSVKTDSEVLNSLVSRHQEVYEEHEMDDEELLDVLENIEYLVHQYDNALLFVGRDGLKNIVYRNMNSTILEVRVSALKIFGACLQNNVKVQIFAFENGGLDALLRILALDTDGLVRNRGVFALSCLLRRFPLAQIRFMESAGLSVLFDLLETNDLKLQVKVVVLLNDLLGEHEEAKLDVRSIDYNDRIQQYDQVNLRENLFKYDFCSLLTKLLANVILVDENDHTSVEECLKVMMTVSSECSPKFGVLKKVFNNLLGKYTLLMKEERDKLGYFHDMFTLTRSLTEIVRKNNISTEL